MSEPVTDACEESQSPAALHAAPRLQGWKEAMWWTGRVDRAGGRAGERPHAVTHIVFMHPLFARSQRRGQCLPRVSIPMW